MKIGLKICFSENSKLYQKNYLIEFRQYLLNLGPDLEQLKCQKATRSAGGVVSLKVDMKWNFYFLVWKCMKNMNERRWSFLDILSGSRDINV